MLDQDELTRFGFLILKKFENPEIFFYRARIQN